MTVQRFLYEDGLRLIAQLDGNNNVVSRFIYAGRANVPDYVINVGVTYRVMADQLGSPRAIIDTSTGASTERLDYDECGIVLADTNPGFQPFSFAGASDDRDTGSCDLVRATMIRASVDGLRKIPLDSNGDLDLYGYVADDPINL